jgi:cytochrome c nitrite reductase small subunit
MKPTDLSMKLVNILKTSGYRHRHLLMIAGCAGGTLLGMGAFTFHTAKGTSYLSNDPNACINCHVMREQHESWQKSSHHGIATCNDCHVPHSFVRKWLAKAEHGWNHSKAFTTGDYHDPIEVKPKSFHDLLENCQRCHGDLTSEISAHQSGPGQDPLNCVRCHSNVGHSARGSF